MQKLTVNAQNALNTFRFPAEFEKHQAVWFEWEKSDTAVQNVSAKIIKELQDKVPIKMAVASYELGESAINFLDKKGIDLNQIEFNVIPGDRFWIRDNGAVFLIDDNGNLGAVDFEWNNYGYYNWLRAKKPEQEDSIRILEKRMLTSEYNKLDSKMANSVGAEIIKSKLAIEGGALETNGNGLLLQCEEVTLDHNPGWTKKQIEEEYRRVLNISKVIWLKKGTDDDGRKFTPYKNYVFTGTGGHLDEFVRFADAQTILLGWIDEKDIDKHPLNRVTFERMNENLKILENATDQDGDPFKIIKIPLPSIIELGMVNENTNSFNSEFATLLPELNDSTTEKMIKVAAVSYLNFLITNSILINASYLNHGTSVEKEELVKAISERYFLTESRYGLMYYRLIAKAGEFIASLIMSRFLIRRTNLLFQKPDFFKNSLLKL